MTKHEKSLMVIMGRDDQGTTQYTLLQHTHPALRAKHDGSYWSKEYEPETDEDDYYLPDDEMDVSEDKIANGFLIAAAPELYNALRGLVTAIESETDIPHSLEQAKAAITLVDRDTE